jgi:adenylate kinase
MENIIFIGGIHGVGKGTLCHKVCSEFNLNHITASEILKWDEISRRDNKLVEDFFLTQNRLINNLQEIIDKKSNYILDGHYCLLNSKQIPERIDFETFNLLQPLAFVIVIDDVSEIKSRLEVRDQKKYEYDLLQMFQEMELEYSIELSKKLKKPHLILGKNESDKLKSFLFNANFT